MDIWITLIKEVGPYLGLMFFFIWRDFRREEQLVTQINELNSFIREELMELIEKTNEAIHNGKSEPKLFDISDRIQLKAAIW